MAPEGDGAPGRLPPWQIEAARPAALRDGRAALLRPLQAGDAGRMAAFFAALTEREIYYFFDLDEMAARALALHAATDPAYRLVAVDERDQAILGYAYVQGRGAEDPTFGLCLRGDAQSLGLGWRLVDHLFASAAAPGVGRVALTVHPDNGRALRLYQRAGFRLSGELINRHQGVKQYRMVADLQQQRPVLLTELAVIPVGGLGVGVAAATLQRAVEARTRRLPPLLDRPPSGAAAILVADLAVPPAQPAPLAGPPALPETGAAWISRLDRRHLLIGGVGTAALAAACDRVVAALGADERLGPSGLAANALAELMIEAAALGAPPLTERLCAPG